MFTAVLMNVIPARCLLCKKERLLVSERVPNMNRTVVHCLACSYTWTAAEPEPAADTRNGTGDRRKADANDR